VVIGGRDATALPPGRRNVAMVFQSAALFPHLTAGENVGFGLRARGEANRDERVLRAAALAGCEGLLDRRPHQLSGGERQRVALARALAHEPDAFLLDEPLSSLDAQLRVDMRAEIKALHQRLENTMLYVTHDQTEALTIGDRVTVMRDGRVEQTGTPDDVFRRPATRFVATFIGTPAMNVLPAVRAEDGIAAGPFRLPAPAGLRGDQLEVGVRPERVRLGDGAEARVVVVEVAGDQAYLYLETEGQTVVARTSSDARPEVGERVLVGAAPQDCYVFDAETGETVVQAGG